MAYNFSLDNSKVMEKLSKMKEAADRRRGGSAKKASDPNQKKPWDYQFKPTKGFGDKDGNMSKSTKIVWTVRLLPRRNSEADSVPFYVQTFYRVPEYNATIKKSIDQEYRAPSDDGKADPFVDVRKFLFAPDNRKFLVENGLASDEEQEKAQRKAVYSNNTVCVPLLVIGKRVGTKKSARTNEFEFGDLNTNIEHGPFLWKLNKDTRETIEALMSDSEVGPSGLFNPYAGFNLDIEIGAGQTGKASVTGLTLSRTTPELMSVFPDLEGDVLDSQIEELMNSIPLINDVYPTLPYHWLGKKLMAHFGVNRPELIGLNPDEFGGNAPVRDNSRPDPVEEGEGDVHETPTHYGSDLKKAAPSRPLPPPASVTPKSKPRPASSVSSSTNTDDLPF